MIEIVVPNEHGVEDDTAKLVITSVQCGDEVRWNCVAIFLNPKWASIEVPGVGNSYHFCNRASGEECGCTASAHEIAYKATEQLLEYYEKHKVTVK